jgi:hypothetical protein
MRILISYLAVFYLPLQCFTIEAAEPTDAASQKVFSMAITRPADAAMTEIEFSDLELGKVTDAEKITGAKVVIIRTAESKLTKPLSPEIQFFRVRSIHKTGVPGPYSVSYSVTPYLRKAYREPQIPVVQQGSTEYLLGSRIELPVQPNLVTRYRLGEGEFIEYKEPLVFEKPATYKMDVQLVNSEQQVVYEKKYIFKVELNPPRTRAVITDPIHSHRGMMMGKNSALVFLVEDAESGMAKIFYRTAAMGKDINAVAYSEYTTRIRHADLVNDTGTVILQYYSIDKAGNKEEVKTELIFCEN